MSEVELIPVDTNVFNDTVEEDAEEEKEIQETAFAQSVITINNSNKVALEVFSQQPQHSLSVVNDEVCYDLLEL